MINIERAYAYCKEDISLIENYDAAIADTSSIWVVHHRDEIRVLSSGMISKRSVEELKENERYYNCPANELIFMTNSEHVKLHAKYREISDETKLKISQTNTGRKRAPFSDETRKKLSIAAKNRPPRTKEHMEKIRKSLQGRKLVYIDERRHYVKDESNN